MNTDSKFVPVSTCAGRLGVPSAWLRREALAGRVPALKAGRRLLADPEAVRAALAARTTAERRRGKAAGEREGAADER